MKTITYLKVTYTYKGCKYTQELKHSEIHLVNTILKDMNPQVTIELRETTPEYYKTIFGS